MITRIELENFKGIREPVSLDLKPITLLFGANSSGKSTVIHALHYALEVLKNHNLDADRTTLGGESVDLGGFRNLVHAHELDRRVGMLFAFDVTGSSLVDHADSASDMPQTGSEKPWSAFRSFDFEDRITTAWVRLEIGWSRPLQAPQVFAYEVGAGDDHERPVIRIEAGAGKGQTGSLLLRANDPLFGDFQLEVASRSAAGSIQFADDNDVTALLAEAGVAVKDGLASLPVYDQPSALPQWGRPLRLWLTDEASPAKPELAVLRRLASKLAVGIGELLVAGLERLLYVGPLRTIPQRNYRPPLTEDLARWAEGLGAWDAIHRRGGDLVARTSAWMKRLDTGYRVELRRVKELDANAAGSLELLVEDLLDSGGALDAPSAPRRGAKRTASVGGVDLAAERATLWARGLQEIQSATTRDELVLVDERSGVVVRPADVGVGISQVLPVVVAALYRGERGAGAFVAIEQPELHVHPKLQVALADLFIEQSSVGSVSDHWFLLETHSEHILLRLLRRIREGHAESRRGDDVPDRGLVEGQAAPAAAELGALPLTPDRVSVIYVQRGDDGSTQFLPLGIDATGEFRDVWPEGFFDERLRELY